MVMAGAVIVRVTRMVAAIMVMVAVVVRVGVLHRVSGSRANTSTRELTAPRVADDDERH